MTSIFKMLVGPYANKRSEIDNESGNFLSVFIFFYGWVGKMVPLPLQMYPRSSLTIFRADDLVLNDTKR